MHCLNVRFSLHCLSNCAPYTLIKAQTPTFIGKLMVSISQGNTSHLKLLYQLQIKDMNCKNKNVITESMTNTLWKD